VGTLTHFAEIHKSKKIWAIGSIHSRLEPFESLKEYILKKFEKDDYLVFLGNIIGIRKESKQTLDSVIDLRNKLMSRFLLDPEKIIFLRGSQEEMFLKLLQLQTAPNPNDIINWMFEHGVNAVIESYGLDANDLINISTQGTLYISKWTSKLNQLISSMPGHKQYFAHLKHAAYGKTKKILFVNRGVDISRPLSAQNDCFWWGYQNFSSITEPYNTFIRIVRGYKSSNKLHINHSNNNFVCSLFKQPLDDDKIVAGVFLDSGEILDLFESN